MAVRGRTSAAAMSSSQGKRKVMGRIDLTNQTESPESPSTRVYAHVGNTSSSSPSSGSIHVRKARVNLSSIVSSNGNGVAPKVATAPQEIRAHVTAASTSSPTVRSPLNKLANYNAISASASNGTQATLSPSLHTGPVRVTNVVGVDSRQPIRSPSPSTAASKSGSLSPVHTSGQATSVSPQQRAKTRPVSTYGQEVVWSSASPRAAPTSLSAKVTSAMNDAKPVRAHLRTHSSFSSTSGPPSSRAGSASPLMPVPQHRSRSPSPTLVKLHQHQQPQPSLRRISHGSTASLGGASSVTTSSISSATKPYSVGSATAVNTAVTLNRPALSSTSYFPGTSSLPLTPGSGLESPVQLQSSVPVADTHPLTSPTVGNASLAPSSALMSPGVELDVEAIEAKTNRKILDLEITNRSLLAINSSLEVVKLQQAREIRDLKRHVREGRALGNRLGLTSDVALDLDDSSEYDEDGDDDDDVSDGSDIELPLNTELEQAHQRCKLLIDEMVAQARDAILSKYETDRRTTGNRVLHPAEVDAMRQAAEQGQQGETPQEGTPIAVTTELEADEEGGGLAEEVSA